MKKILMAMSMIIMLSAPTKKANAVATLASGNAILLVAGLSLYVEYKYTPTILSRCEGSLSAKCALGVAAWSFMTFILLENEANEFVFGEISNEKAQRCGISQKAMETFNQNIEEYEMIKQEVSSQLEESSTEEESFQLWDDLMETSHVPSKGVFKSVIRSLVSCK